MFSSAPRFDIPYELYPHKRESQESWLDHKAAQWLSVMKTLGQTNRWSCGRFVNQVMAQDKQLQSSTDAELRQQLDQLRCKVTTQGATQDLLVDSFALIREYAYRHLGMRHFPQQIMGAWVMINGMIAEMETGQGKTLTATLAAASAALAKVPTHVITVNEYLATRDAEEMSVLYRALGLSCGVVKESMSEDEKRSVYQKDIVYCTNKQVAFDHLRDRMVMAADSGKLKMQMETLYSDKPRQQKLILRGLCFAIVDEADSVLIDEAVTPLVISATVKNKDKIRFYRKAIELSQQLQNEKDFIVHEQHRDIEITRAGRNKLIELGELESGLWRTETPRDQLVLQALKAHYLFVKDQHYLINEDNQVKIIDEFTGRVMGDRSWEGGLQQMIEVKENCEPTEERQTIARISYQRFFRRYLTLAGMSGTVKEVASELRSVYGLNVRTIPLAQKSQRLYRPDVMCTNQEKKWQLIVESIKTEHQQGRPILVGTRSVEASEHLSRLLSMQGIAHKLLNARQDSEEAGIVAQAGVEFAITVATNMAGRGTDIKLTEAVKRLGGMHVIATERHESRRVDRQLFGRCGRQGDPGSVQAIIACDDNLTQQHGSLVWNGLAKLLPRLHGQLMPWLARLMVSSAQARAERRNYQARHSVLKQDENYAKLLSFSGQME